MSRPETMPGRANVMENRKHIQYCFVRLLSSSNVIFKSQSVAFFPFSRRLVFCALSNSSELYCVCLCSSGGLLGSQCRGTRVCECDESTCYFGRGTRRFSDSLRLRIQWLKVKKLVSSDKNL